ncbi:MAG: hypothetical protein HKN87_10565 [Saprospiraceae bacterium]|nr:hypothetical protein [Saprospiraceae bacterium]
MRCSGRWLVLFLISMTSLLTVSCGTKTKLAAPETSPILIDYEQTACMGACPIFKMAVFQDASILFSGQRHTLIDSARASLDEVRFHQLEQLLVDLNASSRASMETIVDAPVSRIRFHHADSLVEMSYQGEASVEFDVIRKMLRAVAKEHDWIPDAQEINPEMISKELIIEIAADVDYVDLVHKYKHNHLTYQRRLAPSQPYHLFSALLEKGTEEAFMKELRKDPMIKKAQWNRKLQKRN